MSYWDWWPENVRREMESINRRVAAAHEQMHVDLSDHQVPPAGAAANGPPDPDEERLIAEMLEPSRPPQDSEKP